MYFFMLMYWPHTHFVCIIVHIPPNASRKTIAESLNIYGKSDCFIMQSPFDISNEPANILFIKPFIGIHCIILIITEKSIIYTPSLRVVSTDAFTDSSNILNNFLKFRFCDRFFSLLLLMIIFQ